ncbi:MAG TPA: sulfotransferase [Aestuariivirga sp.]|nr:sulfotransferase [Aestuariivirga sp.]
MKYFGISFHRTATRSLNEAMNSAGIPSLHFPSQIGNVNYQRLVAKSWNRPDLVLECLQPVLNAYDGHTDVPWPGLWREIFTSMPQSRFIIVLRDPEKWWHSLSLHWRLQFVRRKLSIFERIQYAPYIPDCARETFGPEHRDLFIDAYNKHIEDVCGQIPSDRLLVLDLMDTEKAAQLGSFLQTGRTPIFAHHNSSRSTNPAKRIYRKIVERVQNEFLPH